MIARIKRNDFLVHKNKQGFLGHEVPSPTDKLL